MVHLGVLEGSAVVSYDAVGWNFLFSGGAEKVKRGWLRGRLGKGTTEYSYVLEVQKGLDEVLPFSLGEPSIQPGLVLLFELVYLLLEVEYAGYPWYMAPRLLAFGPIVSVWVRALI